MASARKIADRIAMLYAGQDHLGRAGRRDRPFRQAYVDQFIHGRAEGPIKMQVGA